jgi:hypothetical protein
MGPSDYVRAVAVDSAGQNVYIGGQFLDVDNGITCNRVARWGKK